MAPVNRVASGSPYVTRFTPESQVSADTLESIAKQLAEEKGISLKDATDRIVAANKGKFDERGNIAPGVTLTIPLVKPSWTPKPAAAPAEAASSAPAAIAAAAPPQRSTTSSIPQANKVTAEELASGVRELQYGDTLGKLAAAIGGGVTAKQLAEWNGLPDVNVKIYAGKQLRISAPKQSTPPVLNPTGNALSKDTETAALKSEQGRLLQYVQNAQMLGRSESDPDVADALRQIEGIEKQIAAKQANSAEGQPQVAINGTQTAKALVRFLETRIAATELLLGQPGLPSAMRDDLQKQLSEGQQKLAEVKARPNQEVGSITDSAEAESLKIQTLTIKSYNESVDTKSFNNVGFTRARTEKNTERLDTPDGSEIWVSPADRQYINAAINVEGKAIDLYLEGKDGLTSEQALRWTANRDQAAQAEVKTDAQAIVSGINAMASQLFGAAAGQPAAASPEAQQQVAEKEQEIQRQLSMLPDRIAHNDQASVNNINAYVEQLKKEISALKTGAPPQPQNT